MRSHDLDRAGRQRIGYVLKVYPRFSETFILSEILARESAGADIEVLSLRPPVDGRFHPQLARVRAPVTYIDRVAKPIELWSLLSQAQASLPRLPHVLDDLLAADAEDAAQAVAVALLVRERGITHLHAHFASVATTVARLASRLTDVPYSFTAHAKDIFHHDVDAADVATKLAGAHHVVTVSDYNLAYLRDHFGPAARRVQRVYNGLDLDAFTYADPGTRPPVVAAVGRLIEKKGFDVLVDACATLRARGRRFHCVIAGAGPLADELRLRVSARDLDGTVAMPGPLTQDRVRDLLRSAAVLAAPCVVGSDGNQDGLPTVLLEAMAVGTPCVATAVTGIPEVVRHDRTGLIVPQHDVLALADALDRLLGDVALRRRLARPARALIERDFDSRRQARQLDALLEPAGDAEPAGVA